MLNLNKQLKISQYSNIYDIVISKDHLLRRIKENIDFSFINPLMKEQYCEEFGRPAYEPEIMFKSLFLQTLHHLSDREYISRAETDMSYKYFLELDPEDEVPNYSLLSKFRNTRISEDMLEEFLSETIRQAIDKGIIKSNSIILDSTHSRSMHSPQTPTQILRDMSKELRKEIYRTQYGLSKNFPEKPVIEDTVEDEIEYTKKLVAVTENKLKSPKAIKQLERIKEMLAKPNLIEIQNKNDEEARIGHKAENKDFFGYKNHIAITENEQLITALEVTNGNESDTKSFETLVTKSIDNGIEVKEVLGDTAYSTATNLESAKSKDIKVISNLHPNVGRIEYSDKYVSFNKDAGTYECINGNCAKVRKTKKDKQGGYNILYSFYKTICLHCPHYRKCVTSTRRKYRQINKTVCIPIYKEQKEFQETEYFKTRYKRRGIIEGKNAHLKSSFGLGRTRGTGLKSMKVQSFLTACTSNIVKITRLSTI